MTEFTEIKVKMTNEDGETMTKKFPCYNKITLAQDCPELKDLVDKTSALFKGVVDEVVIKATYQWK